jgi:hypothetical protein
MVKKGFSNKLNGLIFSIITSGDTVNIKMNDQLGPYFGAHRRVRHGNPKPPILFNLVVDSTSLMIIKCSK